MSTLFSVLPCFSAPFILQAVQLLLIKSFKLLCLSQSFWKLYLPYSVDAPELTLSCSGTGGCSFAAKASAWGQECPVPSGGFTALAKFCLVRVKLLADLRWEQRADAANTVVASLHYDVYEMVSRHTRSCHLNKTGKLSNFTRVPVIILQTT